MGVMRQLRKSMKQSRRYETVKRNVRKMNPFGEDVIFVTPRGQNKMSEVLMEFASPLLDPCEAISEQQDMVELAVFAWNLSLLPVAVREIVLEESLLKLKKEDPKGIDEIMSLAKELINTKDSLFPDDERLIISWHIEPGKGDNDDFLSVAFEQKKSDVKWYD